MANACLHEIYSAYITIPNLFPSDVVQKMPTLVNTEKTQKQFLQLCKELNDQLLFDLLFV